MAEYNKRTPHVTLNLENMKSLLLVPFTFYPFINFAIAPKADYIATPKEVNIEYKELFIERNNVKICVWICEPNQERLEKSQSKTILLAYGDYGNMSYYLSSISFYTKLGFTVISFDYRGFGKSSSFNINSNRLFYEEFAIDMKTVISYCKSELGINNLGIVALSMGTIVTPIALQGENAEFIIAEGCIYDINTCLERLKQIKKRDIVVDTKYDLSKEWSKIKSKILIFVASKDEITNLEDAQKIVLQDTSKRNLLIYKGDHLSMLLDETNVENYKNKISLFVNRN
ncbi:alpha/beta hydrolase family protein [Flavobacterium hercynium]|uniref:Serine aminopeptidase S33 domain-containing protein n=1 Tax=Flavobacterium hercynium TaxID=387094 RepID=A0A226HIM0_9FLAO|nr:alpha/beta hydrolase [Flavobacterium hercynium]OXA93506.1 hypothetical protein B0A66_06660 [Flavobacterium hercynium]SMP32124.1 hypothetical protein SAMN06265346_114118 [Flavobacterium hercynium]